MALLDTNAEEIAAEMLKEAQEGVESLQDWLNKMIKEMKRHQKGAFDIFWCSVMMEKALGIYNGVARCNGAVLVCVCDGEQKKDQ